MPVFGFPNKASYDRMARAVRRAGDLPSGSGPMRVKEPRGDSWGFGKLDQDVTAGVLTGGETATAWLGPARGVNDAAIGNPFAIHFATHTMTSGTYVVWQRKRGDVYVQPWECP